MNEAKKLREEFESKLKELQDACPHLETQIMPYMWAPGHMAGHVKVCTRCEKILKHLHANDSSKVG